MRNHLYNSDMKKIVIDVLGGDHAPNAILDGVVAAGKIDSNLQFLLVGDESIITNQMTKAKMISRCEVVHSVDCISNDEAPTVVKSRTESSIAMGINALKTREDCGAFVSAGSTGAVLAASVLMLGRIPGVSRPALCPGMPTYIKGQKAYVLDVGANMDCRPEMLLHFAIMGSEYCKLVAGKESPRVGLINVGTEDKKGNELSLAAHKLLKECPAINFTGNAEARDVFSGDFDVLVCDGFVGNVLLKSCEGSFMLLGSKLKSAFTSGIISSLAALCLRGKVKTVKREVGHETVGGACFLGTKKPVIKAHGSSSPEAVKNAILLAAQSIDGNLSENIETAIKGATAEQSA